MVVANIAVESGHNSLVGSSRTVLMAPAAKDLPVTPAPPHYPAHFMKGSIIQLATGEFKRVEDMQTEDFERCAAVSPELSLDTSTVLNIEHLGERGTVYLTFCVGQRKVEVILFCGPFDDNTG